MAGWLVPVAAWLVLPLLSAGECPQKGTGLRGNRGSPASWTGCFFAPRFHLATPRSPLTHPPSRWAIDGGSNDEHQPLLRAGGPARAVPAAVVDDPVEVRDCALLEHAGLATTAGRKARLISEPHPTFWAFWIRNST